MSAQDYDEGVDSLRAHFDFMITAMRELAMIDEHTASFLSDYHCFYLKYSTLK